MSNYSRRKFIRQLAGTGCASLTLAPFLSGITNLNLLNAAVANNQPILLPSTNDYKALVCIMLNGGNDSFNMLVPYDDEQYNKYEELRGGVNDLDTNVSGMALSKNDLHPLNVNIEGAEYGLHPQMEEINKLFNGESIIEEGVDFNPNNDKYISFVANVGTLLQKDYTLSDFNARKCVPYQIGSHSDQAKSWQTCMVDSKRGSIGWGGRMADMLHSKMNMGQNISMNIALDRANIFQTGEKVFAYTISSTNGSILINNTNQINLRETNKRAGLMELFNSQYGNVLEKAAASEFSQGIAHSNILSEALSSAPDFNYFPNTTIGKQLKMIAKTIAVKDAAILETGFSRQTFFVNHTGYDNHNDLMNLHSVLMKDLNDAIYSFYKAMKEINFLDKVTGFTMSDFARTLTSNGDGSDHAWGGHQLVFGGAINGGQIFGTYPDLINNNLDIGNGRFIPTTSCDEYFADLALWFEVMGLGKIAIPHLPSHN